MTKERARLDRAFEDIFNALITGKINTVKIGEVTEFFKTKPPRVSVQIVTKRLYEGADESVLIPVLLDVPIIYPGAGDWWLTFPVVKGSNVVLLFNDRSISEWLDQGGLVEPMSTRKFSLSDAIAIAGILPDPDNFDSIDEDGIALRKKDNSLFLKLLDSGIIARLADMDVEITADEVKAKPTKALTSTDVKVYNHIGQPPPTFGYVSLLNHVHLGGTLGGGLTDKPNVTEPGPP